MEGKTSIMYQVKKNNVGYNVSNVCDDPQLNSLEPITKTNFLQRQSKFI